MIGHFSHCEAAKLKAIWALGVRLQMENRVRELAFFSLGIDCKLRGCDLVSLKVRDICRGEQVATRAVVMQHKTQRPVQFEITPATRDTVHKWIKKKPASSPTTPCSRAAFTTHRIWARGSTRQHAHILEGWVEELGLDAAACGMHSMRRTKATLMAAARDDCPARHSSHDDPLERRCGGDRAG